MMIRGINALTLLLCGIGVGANTTAFQAVVAGSNPAYRSIGSIGVMDSTQHYGCWNEGSNPSWGAIKTKGV